MSRWRNIVLFRRAESHNKHCHQDHILFGLPDSVASCILAEWIDLKALTQLDSACMSKQNRSRLLVLFRSPEMLVGNLHKCRDSEIRCHAMKWIEKRNIKTSSLFIVDDSINIKKTSSLKQHKSANTFTLTDALRRSHIFSGRLERLHISQCLSLEGLEHLLVAVGSSLQRLEFDRCRYAAGKQSISGTSRLPRLRSLVLNKIGCRSSLPILTDMLRMAENIVYVSCTGMQVAAAHLFALTAVAPALVALRLRDCEVADVDAAVTFFSQCTKLEVVEFDSTVEHSDRCVEALLSSCHHLRVLHLGSSPFRPSLQAETVSKVLRCLPASLTQLGMDGVRLTDSCIADLAECGGQLQCLVLLNTFKASVGAVYCGLPGLLHLDRSFSLVTDSELLALSCHCAQLQTLRLKGCEGFTAPALLRVVQGCPLLHTLTVDSTKLITAAVLEQCRQKNPQLRVVTSECQCKGAVWEQAFDPDRYCN